MKNALAYNTPVLLTTEKSFKIYKIGTKDKKNVMPVRHVHSSLTFEGNARSLSVEWSHLGFSFADRY